MNGNTALAGRKAMDAILDFLLEALDDTTLEGDDYVRAASTAADALNTIEDLLPGSPLTFSEVSARRENRADAPTPPSPLSQGGGDNSQPQPGN